MLRLFFVPCSPVFWGGVWRLREEKKQGDHLTEEPAGKPRLIFHASLPPPTLFLPLLLNHFFTYIVLRVPPCLSCYTSSSSPTQGSFWPVLCVLVELSLNFPQWSGACVSRKEKVGTGVSIQFFYVSKSYNYVSLVRKFFFLANSDSSCCYVNPSHPWCDVAIHKA